MSPTYSYLQDAEAVAEVEMWPQPLTTNTRLTAAQTVDLEDP
ncbi:MAG: hypothetical protein AAFX76_00530 [Planctomycetota bacterium]